MHLVPVADVVPHPLADTRRVDEHVSPNGWVPEEVGHRRPREFIQLVAHDFASHRTFGMRDRCRTAIGVEYEQLTAGAGELCVGESDARVKYDNIETKKHHRFVHPTPGLASGSTVPAFDCLSGQRFVFKA